MTAEGGHAPGRAFFDQDGNLNLNGTAIKGSATQTETVTTDANTFFVEYTFDYGHFTPVHVKITVLALTPDGETFGTGNGDISVAPAYQLMTDTGSFVSPASGAGPLPLTAYILTTVAQEYEAIGVATRYAKVRIEIQDTQNTVLYVGANHPTATVRIDVDYL